MVNICCVFIAIFVFVVGLRWTYYSPDSNSMNTLQTTKLIKEILAALPVCGSKVIEDHGDALLKDVFKLPKNSREKSLKVMQRMFVYKNMTLKVMFEEAKKAKVEENYVCTCIILLTAMQKLLDFEGNDHVVWEPINDRTIYSRLDVTSNLLVETMINIPDEDVYYNFVEAMESLMKTIKSHASRNINAYSHFLKCLAIAYIRHDRMKSLLYLQEGIELMHRVRFSTKPHIILATLHHFRAFILNDLDQFEDAVKSSNVALELYYSAEYDGVINDIENEKRNLKIYEKNSRKAEPSKVVKAFL